MTVGLFGTTLIQYSDMLIKDLSISINPQTGKKYTCREIGLIMNCSRTTVSNILNNKSSGKYASVRVGENTAF